MWWVCGRVSSCRRWWKMWLQFPRLTLVGSSLALKRFRRQFPWVYWILRCSWGGNLSALSMVTMRCSRNVVNTLVFGIPSGEWLLKVVVSPF